MKKRELVNIVSKVFGLYFLVRLMQSVSLIPMLIHEYLSKGSPFSDYYFIIVIIAVYYLFICWLLIGKASRIASFIIKDSENSDVKIGIGKDGLQQVLIYAAGVYLMLDIVVLISNVFLLANNITFKVALDNIILSAVKVLVGSALIIFFRPISRFTDSLAKRFK